MKKIVLIIAVAILTIQGMAQQSQLNTLFDKYSGKEGYTSVYITSYMFELFSKLANEDDFDNVTKGLEAIKILTSDGSPAQKKAFYEDVNKALPASVYKDFMIVKDGAQEVIFKVRDEDDKITEFVMIVKDEYEPVLLFLQGDIDLAQVAKMSKSMDIKGFEHLEKVDDE
ncbi:MAG: DUF4252 domain-containing protein [Salinivirgaceae bacterium]|jgi:hypothetical protein|nr:DUF4252 domain-containing protein [Salinivirgaceae bacterium]